MSTSEGKKLDYNDFQSLLKMVLEDNAQILDKTKREYETKLYYFKREHKIRLNDVKREYETKLNDVKPHGLERN